MGEWMYRSTIGSEKKKWIKLKFIHRHEHKTVLLGSLIYTEKQYVLHNNFTGNIDWFYWRMDYKKMYSERAHAYAETYTSLYESEMLRILGEYSKDLILIMQDMGSVIV
jgi:hypothetical protein